MMYIYVTVKELFPVLSSFKGCGFNDADQIKKAYREIAPQSDEYSDRLIGRLTLVRSGESPIDMLIQNGDGESKTVSLENKGDAFAESPFLLWDGLEHFHPGDQYMFPKVTVDGSALMLLEYGLSARLGEQYAEIQWIESLEPMEMDFQTDSEIMRRVFQSVESRAPNAKVLFHWPFDGTADWYQFKSRRTAPTSCESFPLTTGPAEEIYDIDKFVNAFDRFTAIKLLA